MSRCKIDDGRNAVRDLVTQKSYSIRTPSGQSLAFKGRVLVENSPESITPAFRED